MRRSELIGKSSLFRVKHVEAETSELPRRVLASYDISRHADVSRKCLDLRSLTLACSTKMERQGVIVGVEYEAILVLKRCTRRLPVFSSAVASELVPDWSQSIDQPRARAKEGHIVSTMRSARRCAVGYNN